MTSMPQEVLDSFLADVSWQQFGACRSRNPDLFFPSAGETARFAKNICRECLVIDECLEYALETRQPEGIWGGMDRSERRTELRYRSQEARGIPRPPKRNLKKRRSS